MKLLIALHHRFELWNAPAWLPGRIAKDFPQLEVVSLPDYERVADEIGDVEILLAWSLIPRQFAKAKNLRWIHSTAAAVHQLLFPELAASAVVITNARDVHGPVVAEHAIAVMFALAKRLPSAIRYQRQRKWGQEEIWKEQPPPHEISGSTLGLIGLGSIGREVASHARSLGMRVLAVREHPEKGRESAHEVYGLNDLNRVLSQADFVVLAAPLTAASQRMMNAESLKHMKATAYLINVSRGPLIEDAALVEALRSRTIAGAALDVFPEEPLPAASDYWELENCLITPHTAAVTEKLWERHYVLIHANLERYLAGQALLSVVDKKTGY